MEIENYHDDVLLESYDLLLHIAEHKSLPGPLNQLRTILRTELKRRRAARYQMQAAHNDRREDPVRKLARLQRKLDAMGD